MRSRMNEITTSEINECPFWSIVGSNIERESYD